MKKILVMIMALAVVGTAKAEKEWHSIAVDDFGNNGKQPYLTQSDGNARFNLAGFSKTLSTVAFGNTVEVIYKDIDPVALYRLKLQFTSDSGDRKQSIVVNGETLKQPFTLKKGEVTEVILEIPQTLANKGTITLQIKKHAGSNVVISYAELLSSKKQKVGVARTKKKKRGPTPTFDYSTMAPISAPRLSPLPVSVSGATQVAVSLDGQWKFTTEAPDDMTGPIDTSKWSAITVPGEWVMQGFNVPDNLAAGYFRTFDVPKSWKGCRVKLRFNAVYSDAVVYVNGKKAGSHLGGFTAFELDVTDLVTSDTPNTLSLSVKNESVADSLASGSKYACHPLGGIPRSVSLFALPTVNISSLVVRTKFDKEYKDATLTVIAKISNESTIRAEGGNLKLELREWGLGASPARGHLILSGGKYPALKPGETKEIEITTKIESPKPWTCETPNLYVLTCKLVKSGKVEETINQRFGFLDIEVKGAYILVNGRPIALRGTNRHEVYPLTGRSVPKEMYRKDIELFREANVNLIRTCHYPPDEQLMEAADELGMFIECEGPYCWAHKTKADTSIIAEATVRQNMEMVVLNRNHPSILYWSLGNESRWNAYFAESARTVAELDPTRPMAFDTWGHDGSKQCKVGSKHYPGIKARYGNGAYPKQLGEYCHLNAYNRYELATDQALRDKWGIYLHRMWEAMYKDSTCAGGSTWAGIDDTFYWDFKKLDGSIEERTVGYGTWGPIDGWRRPKPEYWGMKKTYSPIRIQKSKIRRQRSEVVVPVENRQDFSNLNRLKINWKMGGQSGMVSADIAPRSKGELVIQAAAKAGDILELVVDDPRGFNVDSFRLPIGNIAIETPSTNAKVTYSVNKTSETIEVKGTQTAYTISLKTGRIMADQITGPYLMVLPLNSEGGTQMHGPTKFYEPYTHTCSNWKTTSVKTAAKDGSLVVTVSGSYKEATGNFLYTFNSDGTISIGYDFKTTAKVNPRQIGVVFELPKSYENLSWKRKGYWTTYPQWHIARLEGTAKASEGFDSTPVGHRTKPNHEWRHDRTKIGSNDFASTKHNVYHASLTNAAGRGLKVIANADRHVRAWNHEDSIRLLIAHYSNGGSERFLRRISQMDDRPLKKGDRVTSTVTLRFGR